ncbi:MAG: hypothetical protein Q7S26_01120 [bacterium]|nr:hypothetical protein [bacterium]
MTFRNLAATVFAATLLLLGSQAFAAEELGFSPTMLANTYTAAPPVSRQPAAPAPQQVQTPVAAPHTAPTPPMAARPPVASQPQQVQQHGQQQQQMQGQQGQQLDPQAIRRMNRRQLEEALLRQQPQRGHAGPSTGYAGQQGAAGPRVKKQPLTKELLENRGRAIMGPGPAGAAYEGYRGIAGTSLQHPCIDGYEPTAAPRMDKETKQAFVRCYKRGGGPSLVTE